MNSFYSTNRITAIYKIDPKPGRAVHTWTCGISWLRLGSFRVTGEVTFLSRLISYRFFFVCVCVCSLQYSWHVRDETSRHDNMAGSQCRIFWDWFLLLLWWFLHLKHQYHCHCSLQRGSCPDVMSSGGRSVSQLNAKIKLVKYKHLFTGYLQKKKSSEEAPEGRIHSHNWTKYSPYIPLL